MGLHGAEIGLWWCCGVGGGGIGLLFVYASGSVEDDHNLLKQESGASVYSSSLRPTSTYTVLCTVMQLGTVRSVRQDELKCILKSQF